MIEQIQQYLPLLATFLLGVLGSVAYWQKFKTKIRAVRNFIVEVDDAIYDDSITENEFRKVWESAKRIIS